MQYAEEQTAGGYRETATRVAHVAHQHASSTPARMIYSLTVNIGMDGNEPFSLPVGKGVGSADLCSEYGKARVRGMVLVHIDFTSTS